MVLFSSVYPWFQFINRYRWPIEYRQLAKYRWK